MVNPRIPEGYVPGAEDEGDETEEEEEDSYGIPPAIACSNKATTMSSFLPPQQHDDDDVIMKKKNHHSQLCLWQSEDRATETTATTLSSYTEVSYDGETEESSATTSSVTENRTMPFEGESKIPCVQKKAVKTNNRKRRAVAVQPEGAATTATSNSRLLSARTIQEWHVVLGDTKAYIKTTEATKLLRQVKTDFKLQYHGRERYVWIPLAIADFDKRLQEHRFISDDNNNKNIVPEDQIGQVLLKCTKKSFSRIGAPYTHAYDGEEAPTYGIASDRNEALAFFLNSRDAPTLAGELSKHKRNLATLRTSHKSPPEKLVQDFATQLQFFQAQFDKAQAGDAMAKMLLDNLSVIQALNKQWVFLKDQPGGSVSGVAANSSVGNSKGNSKEGKSSRKKPPLPTAPQLDGATGAASGSANDEHKLDTTTSFPDQDRNSSPCVNVESETDSSDRDSKGTDSNPMPGLNNEAFNWNMSLLEPDPIDQAMTMELLPELQGALEGFLVEEDDNEATLEEADMSADVGSSLAVASIDDAFNWPALMQIDDDEPTSFYYVTMSEAPSAMSMRRHRESWLERICDGRNLSDDKESSNKATSVDPDRCMSAEGIPTVAAEPIMHCQSEAKASNASVLSHDNGTATQFSATAANFPSESVASFATFVSYVSSQSQIQQQQQQGDDPPTEAEVLEVTDRISGGWDSIDFKDQALDINDVMARVSRMSLFPPPKDVGDEEECEEDNDTVAAICDSLITSADHTNLPTFRQSFFRRFRRQHADSQGAQATRRRRRPMRGVIKRMHGLRKNGQKRK